MPDQPDEHKRPRRPQTQRSRARTSGSSQTSKPTSSASARPRKATRKAAAGSSSSAASSSKSTSKAATGPDTTSPPTTSRSRLRGPFGPGHIAVALLTVVVLVFTGYAWSNVNALSDITKLSLNLGDGSDGAVDILLVGTDSRTDAQGNPLSQEDLDKIHSAADVSTNTDTIVLIRIPNDGSSATAISIPRDTYINVPGLGKSKINAAYGATKETKREQMVNAGSSEKDAEVAGAQAGREALIAAVQNLTGASIDRYAEVGLLGFVLLTDAVGGVPVCLKNNVRDSFSGARFRKGEQSLDGSQALSFVRQRHGLPRGDLDRIARQQAFMASLAHKVLSAGTLSNPNKLGDLENAVNRSIAIDGGWDVLDFVQKLKDLTGNKIRFATIPVLDEAGWSDDGQQSVVVVNTDQVHAWTQSLLATGKDKFDPSEYTVDVTNAGTIEGLAANVMTKLAAQGFLSGQTNNDQSAASRGSRIIARENNDAAKKMSAALGGIPVVTDSSVAQGHVRVVLTDSYTGPGSISDTGSSGSTSDSGSTAGSTKKNSTSTTNPNRPAMNAASNGPTCVN